MWQHQLEHSLVVAVLVVFVAAAVAAAGAVVFAVAVVDVDVAVIVVVVAVVVVAISFVLAVVSQIVLDIAVPAVSAAVVFGNVDIAPAHIVVGIDNLVFDPCIDFETPCNVLGDHTTDIVFECHTANRIADNYDLGILLAELSQAVVVDTQISSMAQSQVTKRPIH